MNTETLQAELDRRYANIRALHQAMENELQAIERLKQQKGKVKTGVGLQAVARRQAWEQRKQVLLNSCCCRRYGLYPFRGIEVQTIKAKYRSLPVMNTAVVASNLKSILNEHTKKRRDNNTGTGTGKTNCNQNL